MLLSEITLEKGEYFKSEDSLYYILDVLLENQYVILEDCYTENKVMITNKEFDQMEKQVIVPVASA